MEFLKREGKRILTQSGKEIKLKGINFGGWLMMEGYIVGGRNITETCFKTKFISRNSEKDLIEMEGDFRNSFITENDVRNVSEIGFNCIRLPFNYKIIDENKIEYIDEFLNWCGKYNVYCILDMHSVPGSQNGDWHSDGEGKSDFWDNAEYKQKFFKMWDYISNRYRDRPEIAAYDVMNEPVVYEDGGKQINKIYKKVTETIRKNDTRHIIMLEGNMWATDIEMLSEPYDSNTIYSIHYYEPIDFVFNFDSSLKYPGKIDEVDWNSDRIRKRLEPYYKISQQWKVPVFVGEFGVNYRCGCCGELEWLKDCLKVFDEYNFHWSYWTYKTVPAYCFPDGLYRYFSNSDWVARQSCEPGWESWINLWRKRKKDIIESWDTEKFTLNKPILNILNEE